MQVERKMPDMEAILEVFRELGLEDARVRDKFQQLAELGNWHTWKKRRLEPQETLNWNQLFDETRVAETGIGKGKTLKNKWRQLRECC